MSHALSRWTRREALLGAAALLAPWGQLGWAAEPSRPRLVVVVLRGGLDGLAAVAPWSDLRYGELRGGLALSPPGETDGLLDLGEGFGLHAALPRLHARWAAGELALLHAAATPYRERSHFDGQDALERGAVSGPDVGWLARALARRQASGVALSPALPLLLRGGGAASTWSSPRGPSVEDDTLDRLADLYAADPVLAAELAEGRATAALVEGASTTNDRPEDSLVAEAQAAAALLAAPEGPDAAVLQANGWDTHANQGAASGALARRLAGLDAALDALRIGLGETWRHTVVLVLSEFGRTARVNGTGGTDHGTAGLAMALGGGVRGGWRGDWPGLDALHEDRDLRPVNDTRALCAAALRDLWGLEDVFDGVRALDAPLHLP